MMFKKHYKAYYDLTEFEMTNEFENKSLIEIKRILTTKLENTNFKNYECYWIIEYNLIRRQNKQHYFSMKDKQWHYFSVSPLSYISYIDAIKPFRTIAQWFLETFGYKSEQDKRTMRRIQMREIENLYPQRNN